MEKIAKKLHLKIFTRAFSTRFWNFSLFYIRASEVHCIIELEKSKKNCSTLYFTNSKANIFTSTVSGWLSG